MSTRTTSKQNRGLRDYDEDQAERIPKSRQAELENGSRNREALAVETSPEELDRIQHAQERDFAIGALDRESMRLREVRAAVKRIDTDTFGVCLNCEQDISMKRLAAIPWTELCIICQEAADNRAGEPWDAAESPLASAA
jgi:DnaK suppressor protein